MRITIKKADGRVRHWVAKTSRGLNKQQKAEIEAWRNEPQFTTVGDIRQLIAHAKTEREHAHAKHDLKVYAEIAGTI